MDCLHLRQSPGPFHYLISEQAKSLVALQELQHEVGALLEFRDLVIETFPNLRTKMANSTPATMMTSHHSNIPVSLRAGDWTPGIRVRKKLSSKEGDRSSKKADSTIQDSGFSTETSSKETHSASSTAPPASTVTGVNETNEAEDELWNLLDVIHRKGTRLKDEVEALQGAIREQGGAPEEGDFRRVLFRGSADDIHRLRRERDLLLDRLAEMEAEVEAGRVHTSRLQEDLEHLLTAKQNLEEQLRAVVTQRGEVNSRIHDLHSQFVARSAPGSPEAAAAAAAARRDSAAASSHHQRTAAAKSDGKSVLDAVLGDRLPRVNSVDSNKFTAILKERDPLILRKHLLTTTVHNEVLQQQLNTAARLEVGLVDKLDKAREENEDLRFQLEDKSIELEGTRARVRMLELLQKPLAPSGSPDIIPALDTSTSTPLGGHLHQHQHRMEICPASMKAMSPLPLTPQMEHSSSTESAHDQSESVRRSSAEGCLPRRRPSKIPLKSYTAPRPPAGGKQQHSPAPGARSRSGESPARPHSAQSCSLSGGGRGGNASLPKSRNGSLVTARDSLTGKLRSSESLTKLAAAAPGHGTLRKGGPASKWTTGSAEKINSSSARNLSQSPWSLSSYNSELDQCYPDSLDKNDVSVQATTIETSSSQRFQTANTFLWTSNSQSEFYDSIDSNMASSLYQQQGEDFADCDSLERHLSDFSDR